MMETYCFICINRIIIRKAEEFIDPRVLNALGTNLIKTLTNAEVELSTAWFSRETYTMR
jgi:hypothetical protein